MRKHHKIILGSAGTVVFVFMIVVGVMLYGMHIKQEYYQEQVNSEIANIQASINELSENVLETQTDLNSLNTQVGSIDEEFDLLKASVSSDFSGIFEDAVKSVVSVITDSGQGTGFIINEEGYVVTNAHVLANSQGYLADNIRAVNYEGETISADFIGFDSEFDLALLKISGNYDKLILANSDEVQIGEKVIAIGNPLGLDFSVSEGIVSQIHREGMNGINAYIQTTAALNAGNSGGPLINSEGEIIGINNFKIGEGESLGFALESNYIKDVVNYISLQELNETLIQ